MKSYKQLRQNSPPIAWEEHNIIRRAFVAITSLLSYHEQGTLIIVQILLRQFLDTNIYFI